MKTKTCNGKVSCGETKPLSEFYHNGITYSSNCKACISIKNAANSPFAKLRRENKLLKLKGERKCKVCKKTKLIDDFYSCKAYTDSTCKKCNGVKEGFKGATSVKAKQPLV